MNFSWALDNGFGQALLKHFLMKYNVSNLSSTLHLVYYRKYFLYFQSYFSKKKIQLLIHCDMVYVANRHTITILSPGLLWNIWAQTSKPSWNSLCNMHEYAPSSHREVKINEISLLSPNIWHADYNFFQNLLYVQLGNILQYFNKIKTYLILASLT